jgi:two-component system, cell cycle sensor histidine kinase PleC
MYLTQKYSQPLSLKKLFGIKDKVSNDLKKVPTFSEFQAQKPSLRKAESDILESSNSDFLNSIIHELKTPLNAIIGFSEGIKLDIKNPKRVEECLEYAEEISRAANDLNEIIHDILEVNSGTSGNFTVDLSKEIDVKNLIKRSVKLNYDYATRRGISIKTEIKDDVFTIKLDAKRMKQILTNLISNAAKYSPKKTEIKINVSNVFERNVKFLQIIIADQGFGMSKEEIALAFQKYQTLANPNSGKVDSFGLGLPITKQLVELQKGTIEAKSEAQKGTQMILQFPYSKT